MAEELAAFQIVHAKNGWPVFVILTNEEIIHVTNWFDDEGDDLYDEDGDYPTSIVAGPSEGGYWFSVLLSEFSDIVARAN